MLSGHKYHSIIRPMSLMKSSGFCCEGTERSESHRIVHVRKSHSQKPQEALNLLVTEERY
jgi:hypothetical protein